jgi:DNA polymerase-4
MGKFGPELIRLAGRGRPGNHPESEAKSISQEETFTPDLGDLEQMKKILLDQSEQVGWELRKQKLKGSTVTVKVRYPDFTLVTRSLTLSSPTDQGIEIYRTAMKLLPRTEGPAAQSPTLGSGPLQPLSPG